MRKWPSLTELRKDYDYGKLDRKMLEGLIFQYLLDNYERYRLFRGNRERWIEFVSWLYPRISRAVEYYRDNGSTFDTYINAIIKWSSKEYKSREAEHHTTEYACWKARAEELETRSPEPDYFDDPEEEDSVLFPLELFTQRQILILFLKSYYFINDKFLDKVAEALEMEKIDLEQMVDRLHRIRAKKEERIHYHKEMIYSQYYRCIAFQNRLSRALPGSARYKKLKDYLERGRERFHSMKDRMNRIRLDATNKQIGELLGVPKGTIDSTLHNIREKWNIRPLAGRPNDGYHNLCSVTATVTMREIPQTY